MAAYYNEFDPFAAAWLRELIKENLIADGEVDERSIEDVTAADLRGFTQVHLFAGIGGWSYALRLAGWPDDRAVWTGSCPCQPFSAAGKRQGVNDKRHLWPEMRRLIAECAPSIVFGEQVASRDGRVWLAGVRADLEALGYGVGAADLCAAGVGAPHIRQRLYWVADARHRDEHARHQMAGTQEDSCGETRQQRLRPDIGNGCADHGLADAEHAKRWAECKVVTEAHGWNGLGRRSDPSGLADTDGGLAGHGGLQPCGQHGQQPQDGGAVERVGDTHHQRSQGRRIDAGEHTDKRSAWSSGEFIACADGKARRVEPGIQPLAHGVPNRVGTLRGAGNAIVPQVAAKFVAAYQLANTPGA